MVDIEVRPSCDNSFSRVQIVSLRQTDHLDRTRGRDVKSPLQFDESDVILAGIALEVFMDKVFTDSNGDAFVCKGSSGRRNNRNSLGRQVTRSFMIQTIGMSENPFFTNNDSGTKPFRGRFRDFDSNGNLPWKVFFNGSIRKTIFNRKSRWLLPCDTTAWFVQGTEKTSKFGHSSLRVYGFLRRH